MSSFKERKEDYSLLLLPPPSSPRKRNPETSSQYSNIPITEKTRGGKGIPLAKKVGDGLGQRALLQIVKLPKERALFVHKVENQLGRPKRSGLQRSLEKNVLNNKNIK